MFVASGPGETSFVLWSLLIVPVVVLVYLAFVVVAGKDRSEPAEPRGEAVYLHLVVLISLFVGLVAATSIIYSLCQLIGTNTAYLSVIPGVGSASTTTTGPTGFTGATGFGSPTGVTGAFPISGAGLSMHPVGDAAARGAVLGAIILVVAGALLVTHWSRASRYRNRASADTTNAGRVVQAYLNAAMFVGVLILLVAASLATYSIFEIAAPGVAQVSGRVPQLRSLIPLLFFALGSLLIVERHWRFAQQLRGRGVTKAAEPDSNTPSPSTAGDAPPMNGT
jgi:hypothetical protein